MWLSMTCVWLAARALAMPVFQGYGPVSSDFYRLLEKWARAAPNSTFPDTPNAKVLTSGVIIRPAARAQLKQLETLYRVRCDLLDLR